MILRPEAEADLADAADWYDLRREGLGIEFLNSVDSVFRQINAMPELFGEAYKDVRRAPVRRFPFVVYYRIESNEALVLAVLHARRSPEVWKRRQ